MIVELIKEIEESLKNHAFFQRRIKQDRELLEKVLLSLKELNEKEKPKTVGRKKAATNELPPGGDQKAELRIRDDGEGAA